jgi:GTP-binding protein
MTLPRLAIVGRPNVGKSSLLNMLAARRVSITDDTPGTTRDRVSTIVALEGPDPADAHIPVEITDTGGFGVYTAEGRQIDDAGKDLAALTHDIEQQIEAGVRSADLILFVVDAQAGLTPLDLEVARLLREGGLGPAKANRAGQLKPGSGAANVVVIANKCDGPRWEAHAFEAAALGFGPPLFVSARNNYHRRDLVEHLYALAQDLVRRKRGVEPPAELPEMKLAIVGKRNAGKSTLVNTLAGEQRVIVSEIAGTTRDAIDVRFEIDGRSFLAIDTAGVRKKKSFQDRIEWWAFERCRTAIVRADVCLLLIDATVPISQIDKQLGSLIANSYKPCVIVVNKWDLAEGKPLASDAGGRSESRPVTPEDYETYLRDQLKGLSFAPIAFISARNNTNIRETIDLAFEMFQQATTRVGTGQLNRMIRELFRTQGPSDKLGSRLKLFYVAQIHIQPPTIVLVVNKPELFTPQYERFLLNRLREQMPFPEVPIRLMVRARRQDEILDENTPPEAVAQGMALQPDTLFPAGAAADPNAPDWSTEPEPSPDLIKLFEDPLEPAAQPTPTPRPARPAQPRTGKPRAGKPRAAASSRAKAVTKITPRSGRGSRTSSGSGPARNARSGQRNSPSKGPSRGSPRGQGKPAGPRSGKPAGGNRSRKGGRGGGR